MIRTCLSVLMLAALAGCGTASSRKNPEAKIAQEVDPFDPDTMVRTGVEGVYAFKPPPASFNPDTASDQELERYGFPPNANQPKYRLPKFQVIIPTVEATHRRNAPTRALTERRTSASTGIATSENWSGYVVTVPTGTFTQTRSVVLTRLKTPVPSCMSPGGPYHLVAWPGIDGYNNAQVTSPDVLQGGVEMDATCISKGRARIDKWTAWIEWYPNDETDVSFPLASVGEIQIMVWWNALKSVGEVTFINLATHKGPIFGLAPPNGVHLLGNTAEWVIERPSENGQVSTLTPYGQSIFTFARANANAATGEYYIPQQAPLAASGAVMYQVQMESPPMSIACAPCVQPSPANNEEIVFRYVAGSAQNQCQPPYPNCTGR